MFSDRPAPSEVGGLIVRRDLDNGPEGHQFHFLWLARDGGPFSLSRASFYCSSMALYLAHARTRKSLGSMTRKLSETESRNSDQRLGTFSRRNSSVTSANSRYVG